MQYSGNVICQRVCIRTAVGVVFGLFIEIPGYFIMQSRSEDEGTIALWNINTNYNWVKTWRGNLTQDAGVLCTLMMYDWIYKQWTEPR